MKFQHIIILLCFVGVCKLSFAQNEEYKTLIQGTWVFMESEGGLLLKKAEEFEAENYGMTFFEDGTLTRRSSKGLFDINWFDHSGKWHFEDSTLVLLYIFDEKQKAREKVIIKQLDDQYMRLERIDWIEIRE